MDFIAGLVLGLVLGIVFSKAIRHFVLKFSRDPRATVQNEIDQLKAKLEQLR